METTTSQQAGAMKGEEGRRALNDIAQETGLIYDPRTDELVLGLKYVPESAALH